MLWTPQCPVWAVSGVKHSSPEYPLALLSAGWGCTSSAELRGEAFSWFSKDGTLDDVWGLSVCDAKCQLYNVQSTHLYSYKKWNWLTLNNEGNPFADRRWDFVAGNAQVGSHLLPRYVLKMQNSKCKMGCIYGTGNMHSYAPICSRDMSCKCKCKMGCYVVQ